MLVTTAGQAATTYTHKTTYYSASVSQFTMHKQNKSIWSPRPCDECESIIAGQPLCQCAMQLGGVLSILRQSREFGGGLHLTHRLEQNERPVLEERWNGKLHTREG
jgi:hypothetical protein